MAQMSKAKNYNDYETRRSAHHTNSMREESYIARNFNATVTALDEAVQTYRRYNEQGMPMRIRSGQIELIRQLILTCFIILNGVDDYVFVTSTQGRIIRNALNLIK